MTKSYVALSSASLAGYQPGRALGLVDDEGAVLRRDPALDRLVQVDHRLDLAS